MTVCPGAQPRRQLRDKRHYRHPVAAFERVRQAAEDGDSTACDAAGQEVHSRFNALFYLATVRYLGFSCNDVQEGKDPGTHLVEALAFYQAIQPEVANADPAADATIVAFLESEPGQIAAQSRDGFLAALNRVAVALLLRQSDLVTGYQRPADQLSRG